MSLKTGRRQFLQGVAATAAASSAGCGQDGDGSGGTGGSSGMTSGGASGGNGNLGTGAVSGAGGTGTGGAGGSGGGSDASTGGQDDGAGGNENPGPPLTSPIGVALLGLGNYAGGRLAPALQLTQHCRLVGIVTGTPSKIPTWQQDYGIADKNVYSYETMAGLADNPDIHVVYVVTPNHVHAQFAIAAAEAGKHVWLEKPMALNPTECQSIIDACNRNGVKLSIGYRMQHEPNTQTIMQYAATQPFGAIQSLEAFAGFNGFGPSEADVWRLKRAPGGGALYDMGVYSINAARYATGEEPVQVLSASQWTERPDLFTEVDEWTEFELLFPSGVVASCRCSFGESINVLTVSCASGSYYLDPMSTYEGVAGQASDGTLFNQTIQNQQAKQMDDDALALIEGRAVLVPGEEGMRDVRIVNAIQQSAETGQAVDI